jgi:hypothetical protein
LTPGSPTLYTCVYLRKTCSSDADCPGSTCNMETRRCRY